MCTHLKACLNFLTQILYADCKSHFNISESNFTLHECIRDTNTHTHNSRTEKEIMSLVFFRKTKIYQNFDFGVYDDGMFLFIF